MHFRILKVIATSGFLTAIESTKYVLGRGSAPDPAGGGAHSAHNLFSVFLANKRYTLWQCIARRLIQAATKPIRERAV